MKVISFGSDKIAKVLCAYCDYDHYVDISINKELDEKDPDEFIFEFEFDTERGIYTFPPLKQRIQEAWNLLKNENNFRHDEHVDALTLRLAQIVELYEVLTESAKKYLSEEDVAKMDNPTKPEFIKKYVELKKLYVFRGLEGLSLHIDNFETTEEPNKILLHDFGLGWFLSQDTSKKHIRRFAKTWLFKQSTHGFRHMYCSLTKSETVRFLAVLNYIIINTKSDKEGIPCLEI